jgi:hypothetical protein
MIVWYFLIHIGKYTPQYRWLENELSKVNRAETPWLFVLVHAPWYNSDDYHYMEGETMRVQFESWFVKNKVDIVFAGHVHAYERSVSELLFSSTLITSSQNAKKSITKLFSMYCRREYRI